MVKRSKKQSKQSKKTSKKGSKRKSKTQNGGKHAKKSSKKNSKKKTQKGGGRVYYKCEIKNVETSSTFPIVFDKDDKAMEGEFEDVMCAAECGTEISYYLLRQSRITRHNYMRGEPN